MVQLPQEVVSSSSLTCVIQLTDTTATLKSMPLISTMALVLKIALSLNTTLLTFNFQESYVMNAELFMSAGLAIVSAWLSDAMGT